MTTRRSILKMLGLSPVAGALAAREVQDRAIGEMVGLSAPFTDTASPYVSPSPLRLPTDWKQKVFRFLAKPEIPKWYEADLRRRLWNVSHLDADIASKKSWSMNVKIATQRQRNIERAMTEAIDSPRRDLKRRAFEEKYGIWL